MDHCGVLGAEDHLRIAFVVVVLYRGVQLGACRYQLLWSSGARGGLLCDDLLFKALDLGEQEVFLLLQLAGSDSAT